MHALAALSGRTLAALGTALGLACASPPELGPEDFTPATPVVEEVAAVPEPEVAESVELVSTESPEVLAAIREYQETGEAPLVKHRRAGFVTFPFGQSQPILYCKPLRVCEIQLEPGEEVLDVALGDATRWHAQKMESGPTEARRPHVIVKPTDFDISTNLVITTSRRVYHLGLISSQEDRGGYYRSARFYYPADTVARWKRESERARAASASERTELAAKGLTVRPEELHFGYRVEGDRVPWRPVQVFDDGRHVYIQMPQAMEVTEAPALFVVTPDSDRALVNYRVRGRYYVVDRLFARAVLVLGTGRGQRKITITREA